MIGSSDEVYSLSVMVYDQELILFIRDYELLKEFRNHLKKKWPELVMSLNLEV